MTTWVHAAKFLALPLLRSLSSVSGSGTGSSQGHAATSTVSGTTPDTTIKGQASSSNSGTNRAQTDASSTDTTGAADLRLVSSSTGNLLGVSAQKLCAACFLSALEQLEDDASSLHLRVWPRMPLH